MESSQTEQLVSEYHAWMRLLRSVLLGLGLMALVAVPIGLRVAYPGLFISFWCGLGFAGGLAAGLSLQFIRVARKASIFAISFLAWILVAVVAVPIVATQSSGHPGGELFFAIAGWTIFGMIFSVLNILAQRRRNRR